MFWGFFFLHEIPRHVGTRFIAGTMKPAPEPSISFQQEAELFELVASLLPELHNQLHNNSGPHKKTVNFVRIGGGKLHTDFDSFLSFLFLERRLW